MAASRTRTRIRLATALALALAAGTLQAQQNPPAAKPHAPPPAAATAGASTTEAAAAAAAAPPERDDTAPAKPLKPDPALEKLPRYTGTLGGRAIVAHLGPKTNESGLHGEYRYSDTGQVILLAGDRDGETLELEESNDGTNITGLWSGRLDASGALSADRTNADESDPQPVVLHLATAPAPAPAAHPGATVPAGHAVGGVGNVTTSD
ncbi:hypothetical protein GIY62_02155 [Burkholderia plantarii]|uniref:hypothetical protein n=1 Tax=Burkholderia plantarii TaxID=41899 RepID=UPI00272CAD99|nr:hypothetical protein [Burkholderia plantarii]WLE59520.1 hypothetical protein GIY62_02155 [Burkholderia plantarii]